VMVIKKAEFEIGAVKPMQWPRDGLPEIAFVGRSNVGKSSLLNRLLGRKSLARVSATPGKTQQINFFRINDRFRFVDLPGYGYAAVSKTERALFAKMMETYLLKRQELVRVMHLIDIRHEPTKDDVRVHEWFREIGLDVCVVATKLDKISRSQINPSVARIRKVLDTAYPIVAVSSEKNVGMDALWEVILGDLVAFESQPGDANAGVSDQHAEKDQQAAQSSLGTE
jgi:GTP-binding protein